ncbi:hypothetical protein BCR32DRAFT_250331 [Anaeromyces robustus]|uniref:Uncharacterized protein n=1 Tax=Anaeromyces robustus TaxID=1754192 RepID=A0A1Y1W4I5_9FUNG|nr:hypothetical protein BCR32DRAFT_250331 [Anaeromyces robustus]|eukprot:ORX68449.1 hypothetical protein BCR32DRAFT_250331 [Anaeromyces robustus]
MLSKNIKCVYKKFISTNSYPIDLIDKLNELKKEVDNVSNNNEFHKGIQEFENFFEIGELINAAKILNEMSDIKEELSKKLILKSDKTIYNILTDEYIIERSQLKYLISQLLSIAIIFNEKNKLPELVITFNLILSQTKKYFDNPIKIKDIFEVLEIMNMIEEEIPLIINNIINNFIESIVENPTQELSYTRNESHAIITFQKQILKYKEDNNNLTSLSSNNKNKKNKKK